MLTADHGHAAISAFETLVADIMLEFLVPDSAAYRIGQYIIGGTRTDNSTQVGLFCGKQTGTQLPIGGQANTVTGGAERFADGVDEANLAYTIAEGIATRCFRGITTGNWHEWTIFGFDDRLQLGACQDIFLAPDLVGVERHKF